MLHQSWENNQQQFTVMCDEWMILNSVFPELFGIFVVVVSDLYHSWAFVFTFASFLFQGWNRWIESVVLKQSFYWKWQIWITSQHLQCVPYFKTSMWDYSLISIHRQFLCFYFESTGTVNIAGHARVFTVDSSMAASLPRVTITLELEQDRLSFDNTSAWLHPLGLQLVTVLVLFSFFKRRSTLTSFCHDAELTEASELETRRSSATWRGSYWRGSW